MGLWEPRARQLCPSMRLDELLRSKVSPENCCLILIYSVKESPVFGDEVPSVIFPLYFLRLQPQINKLIQNHLTSTQPVIYFSCVNPIPSERYAFGTLTN